jgi:hypothetical protein
MFSITNKSFWAVLILLSVSVGSQTEPMAQSTATAASTPKQVAQAQRKAEPKALRTKRNAELNKLEKSGYNPTGDQPNYPQDLQNAEDKAKGGKAASTPQ